MFFRLSLISLSIFLYSCHSANVIMPDYEGKKIRDENLVIVQVFMASDSTYTISAKPKGAEEELKLTPRWPLADHIKAGSTFKNVILYPKRQADLLKLCSLPNNANDSIKIFLPADKFSMKGKSDSIKYALFLQHPVEKPVTNDTFYFQRTFCFWDIKASAIISYGKYEHSNNVNDEYDYSDIQYEFVEELLIKTPFFKRTVKKEVKDKTWPALLVPPYKPDFPKMPDPPKPVFR